MINEITLTGSQAAPFRQQLRDPFCHDSRHKRPVDLSQLPIKGYPHDGGWKVPGVQGDPSEGGLYWLYIKCPKCGYDWALWKLGVSRSFNPEAENLKKQAEKLNAEMRQVGENETVLEEEEGQEHSKDCMCFNCRHPRAKNREVADAGQEHDPTDDLPRSEENRADYTPGPEELSEE